MNMPHYFSLFNRLQATPLPPVQPFLTTLQATLTKPSEPRGLLSNWTFFSSRLNKLFFLAVNTYLHMVCVEALIRALERVKSKSSTASFHSCKSQPDQTTMQTNISAPLDASGPFNDLRPNQYPFPGVQCPKTIHVLKQLMNASDLLRVSTFNGAMYIGIFAGTAVLPGQIHNGQFHIVLYAAELLRGNPNPNVVIVKDDGGCKCDDVLIPWWCIGSMTSVTAEHAAKLVEPVEFRNAWYPPTGSDTNEANLQKNKLNPKAVPFEPKYGETEPVSPTMASECGSISPVSQQPFSQVPLSNNYQVPQWYPNLRYVAATANEQQNVTAFRTNAGGCHANFVPGPMAYQQRYPYPSN